MAQSAAPRLLGEPRCVWEAGATLGEGTCWSVREQSLYWVDILGHRLYCYTPESGGQRSWGFDETISAVAERASQPGLLVTLQRAFAVFDPARGTVQRLQEPEPDRPGNRFNDGKCDTAGRFWAGTMDFDCRAPTGSLYRYLADPTAEGGVGRWERALDAGYPVTNGPTWSRDGRTLYFTDTIGRAIHAHDVDPDTGALSKPRLWLRFTGDEGNPDGMTTDAAGRLWIAHWGASRVTCRDPQSGAELARVELPTAHITNVAFGGAALDTLYITSARSGLSPHQLREQPLAGGLFEVRVDAAGRPAPLFAG